MNQLRQVNPNRGASLGLIRSGRYGAGVWRGEPWTPRQFGSCVSLAHSALLENPTASSNIRKPAWRHCHGAQAYKRHRS